MGKNKENCSMSGGEVGVEMKTLQLKIKVREILVSNIQILRRTRSNALFMCVYIICFFPRSF